ncbi:MAG: YiaA/YiaB family inner membrane protein [Pseudomonadota bacterium]
MQTHSKAWAYYCWANFAVAGSILSIGIWQADISLTFQAFLTMGMLYITASAFNLAKVLRDEHEQGEWHNRLEAARTEQLLRQVEVA